MENSMEGSQKIKNRTTMLFFLFSCSVMSDSLLPHGLCSLAGSSVDGIFQARIPERVAIFFSRGSS